MLVLGYAEATDANAPTIQVPPFHTGHLGFVPGTPVRVGLVKPEPEVPHREVVVTPFKKDTRDLALVTVAMRDRAGVVARLVGAVAALDFNIEVLESSSIKQLHNHSVTLLVQLPGGASSTETTPTPARRLYQGYDSVLPVDNFACVRLFESIVAHCADIIEWKPPVGDRRFPEIEIRMYPDARTLSDYVVQPLDVASDRKLHARIDLPNEIANGLRSVVSPEGKLEYLLVSDTTTRALHAFFMQPEHARNVFHVGFFHDDVPGALATILALLREAQFNILTSLVRKQQEGRSVWEAVIQYQGSAKVPNSASRHAHDPIKPQEIEWICDRIVAAHRQASEEIVECAIVVAPPRYPVRKDEQEVEPIELSALLNPSTGGGGAVPRYEPVKLLDERLAKLNDGDPNDQDGEAAKRLVRLIQKRHAEHDRPGVFLSYPHSASVHAEALWARMDGRWRLDRYQEPDGEVILKRVIAKIEGCDYFIGIWHPEGAACEEETERISPWMLFEYGVAHAARKPAMIVHSDRLHEDVWRRISPGVASPKYSDFGFSPDTVDLIVDYAERNFV
jgi:acetolactate synthase small subunit